MNPNSYQVLKVIAGTLVLLLVGIGGYLYGRKVGVEYSSEIPQKELALKQQDSFSETKVGTLGNSLAQGVPGDNDKHPERSQNDALFNVLKVDEKGILFSSPECINQTCYQFTLPLPLRAVDVLVVGRTQISGGPIKETPATIADIKPGQVVDILFKDDFPQIPEAVKKISILSK